MVPKKTFYAKPMGYRPTSDGYVSDALPFDLGDSTRQGIPPQFQEALRRGTATHRPQVAADGDASIGSSREAARSSFP